jgi:hypothetical protein
MPLNLNTLPVESENPLHPQSNFSESSYRHHNGGFINKNANLATQSNSRSNRSKGNFGGITRPNVHNSMAPT